MRLGIDPGNTGSVALLSGTKVLECWDMPTYTVQTSEGKNRTTVDCAQLYGILMTCYNYGAATSADATAVYIERQQHNMGGLDKDGNERRDSAFTAFTIGLNYGKVLATIEVIFGDEYKIVHPVSWKGRAGIKGAKTKNASITCALNTLETGNYLTRKKDHGRAEAMLIAFYGE